MIPGITNLLYELPPKTEVEPYEIKKYLKNLRFGRRRNPLRSLPYRNENLATEAKKQAKVDIKLFLFCPILPPIFKIKRSSESDHDLAAA